jgi:glycosyltransferase involved in cell wall biosynthesis
MISVIMPVSLQKYSYGTFKCASNPPSKFRRAIDSFLWQSFTDAELIIVCDGDKEAFDIVISEYKKHIENGRIDLKFTEKQEAFSGWVRQLGLEVANGDIICYLDHDDIIGIDHLEIIAEEFDTDKFDWVYYNDYLVRSEDHKTVEERQVMPVQNSIGTSAIAHKKSINLKWGGGYGHDMDMIRKYLLPLPHTKIKTPRYYVCHCSGLNIDF